MKKMLWVILALMGVVPVLSAQSNLERQVTQKIAQARINQQNPDSQQKAFLARLDGVSQLVKNMTQYNDSQVMQAVVELADDFFTCVSEQTGFPVQAEDLKVKPGIYLGTWAYFVDKPMEAGWTEADFIITKAIDDFLTDGTCRWIGDREKNELAVFSAIIKQYSPWRSGTQPKMKQDLQENKTNPAAGGASTQQEPVLPLSTHLRQ